MKEKKYRCSLQLSAEGQTYGIMYLTKEEYEIVKRVSNTDNWKCKHEESWSGCFGIYCEELEKENNR